jgi:hypothetical protein
VTAQFGLSGRSALLCDTGEGEGIALADLRDLAAGGALLVNISGNLAEPSLRDLFARRAYVDIDPGFTQFWHAQGNRGARLAGHDRYFTIGEKICRPDCLIPPGDFAWRPTRQPVVLEDWPLCPLAAPGGPAARFTTVATWRGPYGPVEHDQRRFGLKVHEFRHYVSLPRLVPASFEAALAIHPTEVADLNLLAENGWHLVDPTAVAGTPAGFRAYVVASAAEFSVAQEMYVASRSGWFSDRTTRYLATGRPALVQDTGLDHLPVGKGLVTFRTLDEAVAGAEAILDDYPGHARAAREVAESCFDSDLVLAEFLEACDL